MKKSFILMLMLVLLPLSAKDWTYMVFLNGDNNLDSYAFEDLNEMEVVGSNEHMDIVVQYDRYAATSDASWSTAKRFHVVQDSNMNQIASTELMDLGEVNSGDYNTVVDFVTWAKENYPAENYALILWDHGSGWQKKSLNSLSTKAISSDDTNGGAHISVANGELETMLSQINTILGKKIDFLGMDACLMAMWEVAFSSENYANYLAFSEETEAAAGWQYDTLLTSFMASNKTAKSLCESTVSSSLTSVGSTLSCVNLTEVDHLTAQLNAFATKYKEDHAIDSKILAAFAQTISMESESNYRDLGMFFTKLSALVSNDVNTLDVQPILSAYNNVVVDARGIDSNSIAYSQTTGMTIFMPINSEASDWESYASARWSDETEWNEFVKRNFQLDVDDYEPDNSIETAYHNTDFATTSHTIHVPPSCTPLQR